MALDQWQARYLDALTEPLSGTTLDETRGLIARMAFGEGPSDTEPILARMLNHLAPGPLALRTLEIGIAVGVAQERVRTWRLDADQPASAAVHPELEPLVDVFAELDRLPDTRRMHAYAQAALLNAIQRLADAVGSPDDLRLVADAYLTLPPPGEDDLDGD